MKTPLAETFPSFGAIVAGVVGLIKNKMAS